MLILGPNGQPARPQIEQRAPQAQGWAQIYEAASRGDFNGYFYFPTLDPSEQLNSLTSAALAERSDWLYKNVGAVAMIIDGLALDEVGGGLWPKWTTENPLFNKAATDRFHFTNHDPDLFSADGHSDFYSEQYGIRRSIRLYGDCFSQFIDLGSAANPLCQQIPGYRIENSGKETKDEKRVRGVQLSPLNRAIDYRVSIGSGADRTWKDVPAGEMMHQHDPFLPGAVRGAPALAAVAKRLFRREDIMQAVANGALARERMGFAIQTQKGALGGAPTIIFGGESEVVTETNPDGTKYTVQKIFGSKARDEVSIPELPAGAEIKVLESNRPGTAVMEFLDSILREVAMTTMYPAEYIFFLAGMGQGTAVRLVLQRVKAVIGSKRNFQLKPQFVQKYVKAWIWNRIREGFFDDVEGGIPVDWWKFKIIEPADMTVDLGREGRLFDDRVATNKMSIESYHGLAGEDAGDVEDENIARIEQRMKKIEALNNRTGSTFTYFDLYPRTSSAPAPVEVQPVEP